MFMSNPIPVQIPYSDAPRLSKEDLTIKHNGWRALYSNSEAEIKKIEDKFGDYLYLPLDIPKIEIPADFVDFYFEHANYTYKRLTDIASPAVPQKDHGGKSTFLTLDSKETTDKCIWTKNFHGELFTTYKDIFEQIYEYFPLNAPIKDFSMWSSTTLVPFHRDASNMLNIPTQFRVLLHNPSNSIDTTLRLKTDAPEQCNDNYFKVCTPLETNSFAWNNLRVMHGSNFAGFNKILFIPAGVLDINWKRYDEILERSFIKYRQYSLIDNYRISDYINE
jgi:hypothetical protein